MHSELTAEQVALLKAPLPQEAFSKMKFGPELTSIKPIYVTERLNEVFGHGKWSTDCSIILINGMPYEMVKDGSRDAYQVMLDMVFTVPEYGIRYRIQASSKNGDPGDAAKGAASDCIGKIASYLDIGIEVYKGGGIIEKEVLTVNHHLFQECVAGVRAGTMTIEGLKKEYDLPQAFMARVK
jgi:hypothetical protein